MTVDLLWSPFAEFAFMRRALLGGVVLLLWQFAVRELLGIYDDAFVKLEDPAAVEAVLKENLPGSGMIKIPHPELGDSDAEAKAMEKLTTGFSLFGAVNLAGKRLFYWSMRFSTWDSCRHLGLVTKKMEKALSNF